MARGDVTAAAAAAASSDSESDDGAPPRTRARITYTCSSSLDDDDDEPLLKRGRRDGEAGEAEGRRAAAEALALQDPPSLVPVTPKFERSAETLASGTGRPLET